ncbi:hydroxymethylglutaryl-CoA reductase (NADPH) [Malassezia vespertilionis]|uniref:3-hydroxy-3-methylglutaryl coenzyme A reductase n=1 Tax=Malassezia vespertilionis TaxID=2020962 RepID=A0A2N1J883_9BASI|nr:hydroxymethylglutaryl-CoA reductase (NADPH) [Malassezia vespertilionis]PKI82766.1 Hmg1p [Malassezia vespertilionis]WFD08217.1 hydroxymethylglutaryl-CoA reductase (NADPH) [Malassezia vespertilionis]
MASCSARRPIEVIVSVFVLVTFAYFYLVHAFTHSGLFSSLSDVASLSMSLQRAGHADASRGAMMADAHLPVFVRRGGHVWQSLEDVESEAFALRDIHAMLDAADATYLEWVVVSDVPVGTQQSRALRRETLLPNIAHTLQNASGKECVLPIVRLGDTNDTVAEAFGCVLHTPETHGDALIRRLTERPLLDAAVHGALDAARDHKALPGDVHQLHTWRDGSLWLQPINPTTRWNLPEAEHTRVSWALAFVRRLAVRAWSCVRNADSIDFTVLLAAYILMHGSFVHLYLSMRRFPSGFWLASSVLLSGMFAALFALLTANVLHVSVDPVLLTESIPFLVIIVGFEKPYMLTKAFCSHAFPTAAPQERDVLDGATAEERFVQALTKRVQQEQAIGAVPSTPMAELAARAIARAAPGIVRVYAMEICILVVGACCGIRGLCEICQLGALIIFFDALLLFTFFVAILCVAIEVHRVRLPHGDGTEENVVIEPPAEPKLQKVHARPLPWYRRLSNMVEHPVTRLKLFLLVTLVSLHALNILSTFTLHTVFLRHHTTRTPTLYDKAISTSSMYNVDLFNPALHTFLNAYASTQPHDANLVMAVAYPSLLVLVDTGEDAQHDILLQAAVNASGSMRRAPSSAVFTWFSTSRQRPLSALDSFMHTWTAIASDPVVGKWLSVVLVISIFLNTFLLKGIATRNPAVIEGNAVRVTAQAAARLVGAHLVDHWKADEKPTKPNVRMVPPPVVVPAPGDDAPPRPFEMVRMLYDDGNGVLSLNDEEVILLVQRGTIPTYTLEKTLQDFSRAVRIRRAVLSRASATQALEHSQLPCAAYQYEEVFGACCENVVGYMPIPVGIAGPLEVDGQLILIPMATTEGTLVASTSRGCKALNAGGGVTTVLTQDAMTRGPVLDFPSLTSAARAKRWLDSSAGAGEVKKAFDSTSRFARLASLHSVLAGRTLFVRFATSTGDAMGMNMISKGVQSALSMMRDKHFPEMELLSLSGNYCTDKKPAAINWIEGRGKSVVAEAVVPGHVVKNVLKTSVEDLVRLNLKKNLVGSAMAGSVGGFNAHASNILTAIYLATGQDPAQNVVSSSCITLMEATNGGADLLVSVSMPSIEVGTVGGGTVLSPQRAMLDVLGVRGANAETPGANAQRLARIISAAVMAGELSLMGALSAGHLIQAHMKHNRSAPGTPGTASPTNTKGLQYLPTMTPLVATPIYAPDGQSGSPAEPSERPE